MLFFACEFSYVISELKTAEFINFSYLFFQDSDIASAGIRFYFSVEDPDIGPEEPLPCFIYRYCFMHRIYPYGVKISSYEPVSDKACVIEDIVIVRVSGICEKYHTGITGHGLLKLKDAFYIFIFYVIIRI